MIGDRVKLLRTTLRLKGKDFAKKAKMDAGYLSKMEHNKHSTPSARLIDDICQAFGCRKDWLETGSGPMWVEGWTASGVIGPPVAKVNDAPAYYSVPPSGTPGAPDVSRAIDACREIMTSDDTEIKTALYHNLIAFQKAVRARDENRKLERRIEALEAAVNREGPNTGAKET